MPGKRIAHIPAAFVCLQFAAAAFAQGQGIEGRWVNPGKSVIMAVARCGDALCGTVQWASEKAKSDSRKGTDQLVGTQLLTGVKETSPGQWLGTLFVPDIPIRATAHLELISADELKVSGCAGPTKLCKSQVWTRTDKITQS